MATANTVKGSEDGRFIGTNVLTKISREICNHYPNNLMQIKKSRVRLSLTMNKYKTMRSLQIT